MGRHCKSHAKVFDSPPAPTSPTQGSVSICFLSFICENTHKEFGIKILEIDMFMIFDLLTLPKGHQFDPRVKM